MQTQTQELIKLIEQRLIKKEDALQYSNKPDELKKNINF
jgi:Tfp pilus assembly pilus retraction ATPase PilT